MYCCSYLTKILNMIIITKLIKFIIYLKQSMSEEVNPHRQFTPEPVPKNSLLMYLWGSVIAIGSLIMGYFFVIVTVLSDSMTYYMNNQSPTGKQQSMALYISICTTAMPLGAFLGSFLYSWCKKILKSESKFDLYITILVLLTLVLQTATLNIHFYSFLRFLQGVLSGLYGNLVPEYIVSISPTKIRGGMGSLNQIMITIGIAIAYGLGYLIDQNDLSNSVNWRLCVIFPVPFCLIKIVGCYYFPTDSIQNHIQNRDWKPLISYIQTFYLKNTLSLKELIKSKNIRLDSIKEPIPQITYFQRQIQLKQNENVEENNDAKVQSGDRITQASSNSNKKNSLIMTLAIVICIISQFSGINTILFYSNQLFQNISNGDKSYAVRKSLELGVFQIIVTIISGGVLDRFGRKTLMIGGQLMIIFALLSGYYMIDFDASSNWDPQYVTYAIFLHMAGFSLSLGPITVIYISEIISDISPYMSLIWVQTIIISFASNLMIEKFGTGKVFLFFAIISIAGTIYLYRYMLETKGRTRKQVIQIFNKQSNESKQDKLQRSF